VTLRVHTAKPIIMTGESVRAILAGRKSQTRRVVTPGTSLFDGGAWPKAKPEAFGWNDAWVDPGPSPAGNAGPYLKLPWPEREGVRRIYPRRFVGDRLWVKETWAGRVDIDGTKYPEKARHYAMYKADNADAVSDPMNWHDWGGRWRSPLFMPRWASRLTLEITAVRVERLQAIDRDGCIAEGCPPQEWFRVEGGPEKWFETTWDYINGGRAPWRENPWVWVLEFRRVGATDAGEVGA